MSDIFGKPAQSSSSASNKAYPMLSQAFQPQINNSGAASNQMSNMLGLNGGPAQTEGFDNWRNSTGYQFGLDQGMDAISGGAASKGLLNSGGTAKALMKQGQDYASTKYGDYMSQLSGLGNQGIAAGGLISDAGKVTQSNELGAKKGMGGMLGSLMTK